MQLWVRPLFLFIFLYVQITGSNAYALSCADLFRIPEPPPAARELDKIEELKIMTFNVENLYLRTGKFEHTSAHRLQKVEDKKSPNKPENELKWIRNILQETSPDIIVLQEIEGLPALQRFAQEEPLKGIYQPFLLPGRDARGIQIGFLVKRDLPFIVEMVTHKDRAFFDAVDREVTPVFSRDLPALIFRVSAVDQPFLVVLGNHGKSKRDRPGDKESNYLRAAQVQAIADIVRDYQIQFGPETPIVLGGDFNTEVRNNPELEAIRPLLTSAFDVAQDSVPASGRITHSFHPGGGQTSYSQLDDLRVSAPLKDQVLEAKVYNYRTEDGREMPLPRSYQERELQPSDHRPIWIRLRIDKMRAIWSQSEAIPLRKAS